MKRVDPEQFWRQRLWSRLELTSSAISKCINSVLNMQTPNCSKKTKVRTALGILILYSANRRQVVISLETIIFIIKKIEGGTKWVKVELTKMFNSLIMWVASLSLFTLVQTPALKSLSLLQKPVTFQLKLIYYVELQTSWRYKVWSQFWGSCQSLYLSTLLKRSVNLRRKKLSVHSL